LIEIVVSSVTPGKARDSESELNAFDLALADAGITRRNPAAVSSMPPSGAEEAESVTMFPFICLLSDVMRRQPFIKC